MSNIHLCLNCFKQIEDFTNYCDWNCMVELAQKDGAKIVAPNGLPISCIKTDKMLEHEHADHSSYMFPVTVEVDNRENQQGLDGLPDFEYEEHALIWVDKCAALTIYEYRYYLWYLYSGENSSRQYRNMRLTVDSLKKIISR